MLTMLLRGKKLTRVSLGSAFMAVALTAAVLTAVPASGTVSEFPTWEDVEQAKHNAADKAGQVGEIELLLGELSAEAGSLGTAAVRASSDYQRAAADAEANNRALEVLARQRTEAAGSAAALAGQMGALAAQTYKTGGMDSSLLMLLDADAAVGAMDRLTTLQGLADRTGSLHARASAAAHVLSSLEEREAAALKIRTESAAEALRLAADADGAAAAADTAVREQQARSAVLLEQLADLRGTSVQVEAERMSGLQAEETYRQQQEAARQAAEASRSTEPGRNAAAGGGGQLAPPPASASAEPVTFPTPGPESSHLIPVAPLPPVPPAPEAPKPAPAPGPVDDPAGAQAYASGRLGSFGWGQDEFRCLVNLWQRESGWRTSANNPYSGAYGIPQSYPGDKMASVGADWRTNYRTQIEWGLGYIRAVYGSPCAAWQHSEDKNWY